MTEADEIVEYLNKLDPQHAPCDPRIWRVSNRVSVRRSANLFDIMIYDTSLHISKAKMRQITAFEMLERLAELDPDIAAKLAEPMDDHQQSKR